MSTLALPPAQPALGSAGAVWRLAFAGALTLLVWALAYQPTLLAMAHVWQTSETYAHGFLIAPIAAVLGYRLRHVLSAAPLARAPLALLPLALAGLLWSAATVAAVDVLAQLAAVLMLIAALWYLAGSAWLRLAWFPCAFLLLAVPLGDGLTPFLIDHTANFVVSALRLIGMPVFREGSFFVIPSGSWSVVTGCSGMRYLMATLTVAALFAHLSYRAVWKQGLFVLGALAIALIANWLRAFGIVMIAHLSDMRLAIGVDHYLYGWVFFGIIIFLLMLAGGRWRDDLPLPTGPCPPLRGAMPGAGELLLLLVLLAGWPLGLRLVDDAGERPLPAFQLDTVGADWQPVPAPRSDWSPRFTGTPTLWAGGIAHGDTVCGWQLAWYPSQRPGNELIHAANRLVQEKDDPWRLLAQVRRQPPLAGFPGVRESLLKASGDERMTLVWQWYWVDGERAADALGVKWLGLRARLLGEPSAGASVLVYLPLATERELAGADERLTRCASHLADRLEPRFNAALRLPGEPR